MVRLLTLILQNPLRSLLFGYTFCAQVFVVLLKRALLPYYPSYQSVRTQLQRAYLSASILHFPRLVHRLPVTNCPSQRAKKVGDSDWTGYVVPGTSNLFDPSLSGRKQCVALYAHGGGYIWGEARQYLNYMERWIRVAKAAGISLTFLSVEYPLSTEAKHPAQLQSFNMGYRYLLANGIPPQNIVFMGDSAGAAMSIMLSIECLEESLPQPAGLVLISPWLDTSLRDFKQGSPLVETCYVVTANASVPFMFNLFRGTYAGDDPGVNPLYRKPQEIMHMAPQLILTGGAETALEDGKDWADLCEQAGIKHQFHIEPGQLHIYAMGSAWLDPLIRKKTDDMIIGWMDQCLEAST